MHVQPPPFEQEPKAEGSLVKEGEEKGSSAGIRVLVGAVLVLIVAMIAFGSLDLSSGSNPTGAGGVYVIAFAFVIGFIVAVGWVIALVVKSIDDAL